MSKHITIEELEELKASIQNLASEALKFNRDKLEENFDVTTNNIKFYNLRLKLASMLNKLESDQAKVKKVLFKKLKEDVDFNLSKSSDMNTFIEADDEFQSYSKMISLTKNIVKYIEDVISGLNTKHFEMKLFLEYKKFMAGECMK